MSLLPGLLLLLAPAFQEKDRTQDLVNAVSGTTRIRVRQGGLCHRPADKSKEQVLVEVKDAVLIKTLIEGLKVGAGAGNCKCCGDPTLEFYREDKMLAAVTFHHSTSLRWEGWSDDSVLSLDGAEFLVKWLTDRGVPGLKADFEQYRSELLALEKMLARTMVGLPDRLRKDIMKSTDVFSASLKEEFPAAPDRVRVLLKLLGAGNGSWRWPSAVDSIARKLLAREDVAELQAATRECLMGTDRWPRRGAAKVLATANGPLATWKPDNLAGLRLKILDVRREAFTASIRAEAIDDLERWAGEIPAVELDARIGAALQDPDPSTRRRAMVAAGRHGLKTRAATLMDILEGKPLKPATAPEIPPDEKELDGGPAAAPGDEKQEMGEPGEDWEWAALGLGWLRHEDARAVIEKKGASSMGNVALALLGNTTKLEEDHFSGHNAIEIRLAGIESVIRCKGRAFLLFAIHAADVRDALRPAPRVEALKQMLLDEKAPGEELIRAAKKSKDLVKWYDAHGAEFVKRLK